MYIACTFLFGNCLVLLSGMGIFSCSGTSPCTSLGPSGPGAALSTLGPARGKSRISNATCSLCCCLGMVWPITWFSLFRREPAPLYQNPAAGSSLAWSLLCLTDRVLSDKTRDFSRAPLSCEMAAVAVRLACRRFGLVDSSDASSLSSSA